MNGNFHARFLGGVGGLTTCAGLARDPAMLNFADLCGLLIILVGPISGFGAALAHKAGMLSAILFAFVGFAVAISVGKASHKYAYAALSSKTMSAGLRCLVYMFVPFIGLLAAALLPFVLVKMIYG